ncbi:hypothetical protein [Providencia rettgeri]|uniref:hypothetical protein n=1 Tax=Providencia rettgeri TaxID=587 RepID=UPI001B369513|nr:hypothetical protein [Providencia rettgeri]MBQ0367856.1 hypothetical protein [Providencia rettgeri]
MSDWKNNPAVTAIISGSIVLTTTLLVVFNYVLPVYQQADKNTIAELKLKLDTQLKSTSAYKEQESKNTSAYKEQVNNLTNENTSLKSEINGYKDYLLKLSFTSAFQRNNPLPIGYSKILPGMKLSSVFDNYEKVRVFPGKSGQYLTVKPNFSGLGDITYYIGSSTKSDIISHIYIRKYSIYPFTDEERQTQSHIDKLSLLDFLNENLGSSETCGNNGHFWRFNNAPYYVFFSADEPDEYSIWLNDRAAATIEQECLNKIWASDSSSLKK